MAHKVYPHGSFERLAEGVWSLRGGLAIPLHRNMVVVRLGDGTLLLHSAVALEPAGLAALAELGKPALLVVPNLGHTMDASFYRERFPGIRLLGPAEARVAMTRKVALDGVVEDVLPGLGFVLHKVPGTRSPEFVYERALESGGRMLMVNDAFGNADAFDASRLMGRLVVKHLGTPHGQPGVARTYRWIAVNDLPALKRFVGGLATIPDLRLITFSHGSAIVRDPVAVLRQIAAS